MKTRFKIRTRPTFAGDGALVVLASLAIGIYAVGRGASVSTLVHPAAWAVATLLACVVLGWWRIDGRARR
jgi:hypothetical protein